MFDIGFFELVLVGVVALLVLGPEKLPGAIRTASLWIGRLRRSFNNIKQDIEREIGADDIRRQLRNEAILDKFKSTKSQVTDTMNMVKKETEAFRKNVELEAQAASFSSTKAGAPPSSTPSVNSATSNSDADAAGPAADAVPSSDNTAATTPTQNDLPFQTATESPNESVTSPPESNKAP
jgi:sec-independent protein translocase protein TatB